MSIVLNDVSYTYMPNTPYQQTALKNINLVVEKGEFIGVIGHTGSGKSSLVQHMNGILKPTNGKVIVDGVDITNKSRLAQAAKHKVGMVFQYPEHQIFEETIYEDIAFGPRNQDLSEAEVELRVRRAMQFVGLEYDDFATRSPFQLSGGQMRRVAIAGVIAMEPDYLVLDEPSAGLDPRGRDEIFAEIVKLHEETGIAVILVSHNMEEVSRMVKRLVVLNDGEITLDGTPQNIFSQERVKLAQAGVSVPNITLLLEKLKDRGLAVDTRVKTIEETVQEIIKALGRNG